MYTTVSLSIRRITKPVVPLAQQSWPGVSDETQPTTLYAQLSHPTSAEESQSSSSLPNREQGLGQTSGSR